MTRPKEEILLEKIFGKQMFKPIIEFIISKDSKYGNTISFFFNGANIFLELSDSEWDNLKNFLLMMLKKENLPEGCQGYSGVDITSGRIDYYSLRSKINFLNKRKTALKYDNQRYKEKYTAIKREEAYVKKNSLSKEISFKKDDVRIDLRRKKFIRFREDFLKQQA